MCTYICTYMQTVQRVHVEIQHNMQYSLQCLPDQCSTVLQSSTTYVCTLVYTAQDGRDTTATCIHHILLCLENHKSIIQVVRLLTYVHYS